MFSFSSHIWNIYRYGDVEMRIEKYLTFQKTYICIVRKLVLVRELAFLFGNHNSYDSSGKL